jgi:hypothetical protein
MCSCGVGDKLCGCVAVLRDDRRSIATSVAMLRIARSLRAWGRFHPTKLGIGSSRNYHRRQAHRAYNLGYVYTEEVALSAYHARIPPTLSSRVVARRN